MSRVWTRKEVSAMILAGETVVIYRQLLLSIPSRWLDAHPGGDLAILHFVGREASDEIDAFHSDETLRRLKKFAVGTVELDADGVWSPLVPPIALGFIRRDHTWVKYGHQENGMVYHTVSVAGKLTEQALIPSPSKLSLKEQSNYSAAYKTLHARVKAAGLYETPFLTGYGPELSRYLLLGAIATIAYRQDWLVLSAISLGLLWHQLTFFVHDLGHVGVTHNWVLDRVISIFLADYVGGLSIGWWVDNHNVHHLVTNHPSHDPDIEHLPFFAISPVFLKSLYSSYYKRPLLFDKFSNYFIALQHQLFYVIMMFGRFNLYANSYGFLVKQLLYGTRKAKGGRWSIAAEIFGCLFFWCWYGYVLRGCGTWQKAAIYLVISHIVTSPVHIQIVLSHFSMSTEDLGVVESFAHRQLRTTTDVICPPWLAFLHGGLHLQVTHHLFPRLPRHNLLAASYFVKQFAQEQGLEYHEFGFRHGNAQVLNVLRGVAEQVSIMGKVARKEVEEKIDTLNQLMQ